MPTLEAAVPPKLLVTAVSPSSGNSRLLDQDELNDLFALLTGFEQAVQEHRPHTATESQAAAMNELANKFEVFGLDIDWFARTPREDQPLFVVRFGPFEKPGYRLKDLLGIAREAGILRGYPRTPERPAPSRASAGEKRIFVVDDDEMVRNMIAMSVTRDGFMTEAFGDGIAMLGAVHLRRPDLIILDLMLPIKGGYEILQSLQAGDTKTIPVIVITGRMIDREMSLILRQASNLVEFIEKPLHPKALLSSIHRILATAPAARADNP